MDGKDLKSQVFEAFGPGLRPGISPPLWRSWGVRVPLKGSIQGSIKGSIKASIRGLGLTGPKTLF